MIIECPSCNTKFKLDDERITSEEVKLRCSRCRHVFTYSTTLEEPVLSEAEESEPDFAKAAAATTQEEPEEPEAPEIEEPEEVEPEPEVSAEEDLEHEEPEIEEVEPESEPLEQAEPQEAATQQEELAADELDFSDLDDASAGEPDAAPEMQAEDEDLDFSDLEAAFAEEEEAEPASAEEGEDALDFSDFEDSFAQEQEKGEKVSTDAAAGDDDLDFSDLEAAFAEEETTAAAGTETEAEGEDLDFSDLEASFAEEDAVSHPESEAPDEEEPDLPEMEQPPAEEDEAAGEDVFGDDALDFSELEAAFEEQEVSDAPADLGSGPEPESDSGSGELDFSELEAGFEAQEAEQAPESSQEEQVTFDVESESEAEEEPGTAEEESVEEEQSPAFESDELDAQQAESASRGPRKKRFGLLLALLIIAGLAAAGFFLYPKYSSYLPFSEGTARNADMGQKQPAASVTSITDIDLQDVRQYFVNNEKVGELFVIEGKAVNRFSKVKELIKIEAELYDAGGNVVQSKQFLCGNSVSLFQLQVLSREELNSLLEAKVGVLTNNTNLEPGAEVPFMTVFYNPPGSVQEFGLKVIEAKDPPKK